MFLEDNDGVCHFFEEMKVAVGWGCPSCYKMGWLGESIHQHKKVEN